MKTMLLNGSPKRKFSVSSNLLKSLFLLKGEVKFENIRNKSGYEHITKQLNNIDNLVIAIPLYVDGIPSHFLEFMQYLEKYCTDNNLHFNIYVISNGGFIEGKQSRVLFSIFKNFCDRAGLVWNGGIGIGGGVMINVLSIMLKVYFSLFILNCIVNGIKTGYWLPLNALLDFTEYLAIWLFINIGVLFYEIRITQSINQKKYFGEKYTRAMIPTFLFIIIADIFFIITGLFHGKTVFSLIKNK